MARRGSYDTSFLPVGIDLSWREDGLCRGDIPSSTREGFFADKSTSLRARIKVEEAKALCRECPVLGECDEFAFRFKMQGVWAGRTEKERNAIIKRQAAARRAQVSHRAVG